MPDISTIRPYVYPLLAFLILSSLYYAKETRGITPLKQGFSNEPLLVLPEENPHIFKNDDYLAYRPIPYIPLHKTLLKFIWDRPENYEHAYRLWLSALVLLTSLSLFSWFVYLSGSILLSALLACAAIVGYFENSWMFLIWGFSDINVSARANFGVLIPIYLIAFCKWINNDIKMLLFFLVLGLGVNVYPAIAIGSFMAYALTLLAYRRMNKKALLTVMLGGMLFLAGSLPFALEANALLDEYASAHQTSNQFHELVDQIEAALTDDVRADYENLRWSLGSINPQGNWFGLFRWFILYPPVIVLFLLLLTSLLSERLLRQELSGTARQPKVLIILIASTVALLLAGWAKHHYRINLGPLEGVLPRLQYLGNFLMFLMYGCIAVFLVQLKQLKLTADAQLNRVLKYALWVLGAVLIVQAAVLLIGSSGGFLHGMFVVNNVPWIFAAALLVWLAGRFGDSKTVSNCLVAIVILAVASGFSFHYDEYKMHYPYFQKHAAYASYVLIPATALAIVSIQAVKSSPDGLKRAIFVTILLLIPFSWCLPARAYNNISLLLGGRPAYFADRFEREPALRELAEWARRSTPISSRFLISTDITEFKAFAMRSTPLLRGTGYEYFGDDGRIYAARNSDLYRELLERNDFQGLAGLARELNVDYAVISKSEAPGVDFDSGYLEFENSHYRVYNLTTLPEHRRIQNEILPH